MKKVLGILLVVAVVAIIIFILIHFKGFGFGKGNGKGNGQSDTGSEGSSVSDEIQSSSDDEQSSEIETVPEAIETTVEEVVYVAVTVQGKGYLYQNAGIELNALMDELKKIKGDFVVRITDENASKKAFDNLTSALEKEKISYEEAE